MYDLAIRSRNTLVPRGMKEALVLIKSRQIAAVAPYDTAVDIPVTDAGDLVLMPGVIDPHVHINEPGRTNWEGFDTATKAAVAGGLTTLVDMPLNSSPVTTTVGALEEKLKAAATKLHTNCGFWGGIVPGNFQELEGLIQAGVLGFKAFLTHSGIDDFPNVTESDLRQAMPLLAKHNLPLLVHCELATPDDAWKKNDRRSYQNYLSSRPKSWEDEAIALMIKLCSEYQTRTHIVHLSSANSIAQIAEAKAKGLPLTVETAQHYLYFCAEDIADGQTQFKCAPPIRERSNREQLWKALEEGVIDFVATDHSPAPPGLKNIDTGDFTTAWGGIASLQLALPVLWSAARKRGHNVSAITRWLCENPAKLIGQENRKGKIEKGFDADLLLWDPTQEFELTEEMIKHRHKLTPYLHEQLYGAVAQTMVGGTEVFQDGKFIRLNQGSIIRGI